MERRLDRNQGGPEPKTGRVLVGFDLQLNRQEEVIMGELHTSGQGS